MNRIKHLLGRTISSIKANGLLVTIKRIKAWLVKRFLGQKYLRKKTYYNDDVLHLAFYPSGGLGDYIISRVILEEVLELSKCEVTIFADKLDFARAIYGDVSSVYKFWYEYDTDAYKYDLALWVEHFVHVDSLKESRVLRFSPKLATSARYIVKNRHDLYVDVGQQCWRERIQFERCRVLGLDRWTELRMQKAFKVTTKVVSIPLDKDSELEWSEQFQGKQYITINYDADAMISNRRQLKMWTAENYKIFIKMIKESFPNIEIVQLGSDNAERIAGVDRYILGQNLEYVKHILKNSLCHIDCEGGLVHLATQLDTKCIVLFGPTPVHMYGYEQNINIVSAHCSNCMGLHEMWAYECYRGCKTAQCMENITPEDVYERLNKVLLNEDN